MTTSGGAELKAWSRRRANDRFGRRPSRPRRPWGRFQEPCAPALRPQPRLDPAVLARADWPELWTESSRQLRSVGLRTGTLRVYRHVLRSFRSFLHDRGAGSRPGCATPALAREFLYRLADRHASWSWTATHISALRTVFDKLGGASLTAGIPTPKRGRRLHDVLAPDEVSRLLKAAGSTRDRLVILLLFGSGLRTSELCGLRWHDVDLAGQRVRVGVAGGSRERWVPLAQNAIPLLVAESFLRDPCDPVFPSSTFHPPPSTRERPENATAAGSLPAPRSLSVRTVERIVRRAAVRAGVTKEACCRTLRRSYAVECLRGGMNVVQLRDYLGHQNLESTLAYGRYLPPGAANSSGMGAPALCLTPGAPSSFPPALATIQTSAP